MFREVLPRERSAAQSHVGDKETEGSVDERC